MATPLPRELIYKVAALGEALTKRLQESSRIERFRLFYPHTMSQIGILLNCHLMVWEHIADLDQYGLAYEYQRSWTKTDWERAIRAHYRQPDPKLDELSEDEIELHRHLFHLKSGCDGSTVLYRGYHYIGVYRRRGNAIRRAHIEIERD